MKGYCNLYDIVIKRLNSKKIELEERQKQFEEFFRNSQRKIPEFVLWKQNKRLAICKDCRDEVEKL